MDENSRVFLRGFLSKTLLFVFIFAGFVTSINYLEVTINMYDDFSREAIYIIAGALIAVIVGTITFHTFVNRLSRGYSVVVFLVAFLVGFGGLLRNFSPFMILLLAAGAPGVVIAIHPGLQENVARIAFGVEDGSRSVILVAFAGAFMYIFGSSLAKDTCLMMINAFSIVLIAAGMFAMFKWLMEESPDWKQSLGNDHPKFKESDIQGKVTSSLVIFTSNAYLALAFLTWRDLGILETLVPLIGPTTTGLLQILAMLLGMTAMVLLILFSSDADAQLAMVCKILVPVHGISLLVTVHAPGAIQGLPELLLRIISAGTVPFLVATACAFHREYLAGPVISFLKIGSIVVSFTLLAGGLIIINSPEQWIFSIFYTGLVTVSITLLFIDTATRKRNIKKVTPLSRGMTDS
ncbi:hypothetical protein GF325_02205 [Candidatus Bathyarchaeota archaeon]|nr:hypothetical protein [Candidatus Bathyarchaeota archaeon]